MSLQHLKLGHTRKWPVFLLDKRHWNIGVESSYERCVTSHIPCFPRYSNCQLIGQQLTGSCRNSLKLLIVKLRTPELQLPAPMTYTTILCTRTQTCTTNFPVLLTFPDLHYEHYQILHPMLCANIMAKTSNFLYLPENIKASAQLQVEEPENCWLILPTLQKWQGTETHHSGYPRWTSTNSYRYWCQRISLAYH